MTECKCKFKVGDVVIHPGIGVAAQVMRVRDGNRVDVRFDDEEVVRERISTSVLSLVRQAPATTVAVEPPRAWKVGDRVKFVGAGGGYDGSVYTILAWEGDKMRLAYEGVRQNAIHHPDEGYVLVTPAAPAPVIEDEVAVLPPPPVPFADYGGNEIGLPRCYDKSDGIGMHRVGGAPQPDGVRGAGDHAQPQALVHQGAPDGLRASCGPDPRGDGDRSPVSQPGVRESGAHGGCDVQGEHAARGVAACQAGPADPLHPRPRTGGAEPAARAAVAQEVSDVRTGGRSSASSQEPSVGDVVEWTTPVGGCDGLARVHRGLVVPTDGNGNKPRSGYLWARRKFEGVTAYQCVAVDMCTIVERAGER